MIMECGRSIAVNVLDVIPEMWVQLPPTSTNNILRKCVHNFIQPYNR